MTLDTKEDALEVAIGGLPRVVEAILAAPAEARTKALDAAAGSYRQTAQQLGYSQSEEQEWVHAIMYRLRTEVITQEFAGHKIHRGARAQGDVASFRDADDCPNSSLGLP